MSSVPDRADWPTPERSSEAARQLTDLIVATFRLNARLMEAGQLHAEAGGLTAAWWQVLGGVLDEPRTVAEIGRRMGMTRQGVQRVADLLVQRDLAEYRPNPAHRRAKLLACTEAGYWAVRRISVSQHPWANRIAAEIGVEPLTRTVQTVRELTALIEADLADLAGPGDDDREGDERDGADQGSGVSRG